MIRDIRVGWVRLLVLAALGLPAITGWPVKRLGDSLHRMTRPMSTSAPAMALDSSFVRNQYSSLGDSTSHAVAWFLYACAISAIIITNVGWREWFTLFSVAAVVTTVTCFTGAAFSALRQLCFGRVNDDIQALWSTHYLIQASVMLSVIPFAMFSVSCFSPESILLAAVRRGKTAQVLAKHLTVIVRVLQHVLLTVTTLFTAWREEHPEMVMPRHRADMQGNPAASFGRWLAWGEEAVRTWCVALLMHTLEPVPFFCREIEATSRALLGANGGGVKSEERRHD